MTFDPNYFTIRRKRRCKFYNLKIWKAPLWVFELSNLFIFQNDLNNNTRIIWITLSESDYLIPKDLNACCSELQKIKKNWKKLYFFKFISSLNFWCNILQFIYDHQTPVSGCIIWYLKINSWVLLESGRNQIWKYKWSN